MEVDDIISYHDVVTAERASLQKGMNYGVGKNYSVFLRSLRENAPYADALDPITGMLTYEGHDEPQRRGGPNLRRGKQVTGDTKKVDGSSFAEATARQVRAVKRPPRRMEPQGCERHRWDQAEGPT